MNVRVDKEVFGLKGNLSHSQFQCSPKKLFCDLIHSEDTFIVRNVGRWSPFENKAKDTQTNMSLEVKLRRTGSDATADFFFLESIK